ncbi:MAG: iron ABC transporter permease [Sphingomonadales bacterium]
MILLLLGTAFTIELAIGPTALAPFEALRLLFFGNADEPFTIIVREIRLPRALAGVFVGATLGLAGATLQGMLRNPLADPGAIGVSPMAGLGAVIAIYSGFAAGFSLAIPLFAMAGALLATFFLMVLSARETSVLTIILVGIGIGSLAVSLTSLVINISPDPFAVSDIVLWLLGSLQNRSYTDLMLAGPFMIVGCGLLLSAGNGLRLLTLGEDTARNLGLDLRGLHLKVVLGAALAVGSSVAMVGAVGFVGLVVPHMVRPFLGHDPGRILVPSALAGALLVLIADIGVRTAPATQELKLGVLTGLLGAPFFLYLVIKTRRSLR